MVVKEQFLDLVCQVFSDTCVNITADGRPYLGATIGSQSYVANYVSGKVSSWVDELEVLALFAITQPHTAFAAFSRVLISKWLFIARTVPSVSYLFQPLENCVRHHFILHLLLDVYLLVILRDLFALPVRMGGLGISNDNLFVIY